MQFTVALDGPAAAGKGTIAKALADKTGFAYLDTGLLYRAVGARHLDGDEPIAAAQSLNAADLEREDLRTAQVAKKASEVAVIPEVREALLSFQRSFARMEGGAILDGRDIGTVICPQAEVKIYVTASVEARARRRFDELVARGDDVTFEQVAQDVADRDARDASRDTAPMKPAEDAIVLDTSDLSIADAIDAAYRIVQQKSA